MRWSAIPLGLLCGSAAAFLLGGIYQWFVDWMPFVYFNFFASLALGAVVGGIAALGMRAGHCRNVWCAAFVAACCGILGGVRSFDVARGQLREELLEATGSAWLREALESTGPGTYDRLTTAHGWSIADHVIARRATGWVLYRGGIPIRGAWVTLVWILEAGLIVVGAAGVARAMAREPYCAACGRWCREQRFKGRAPVQLPDLLAGLDGKDVRQLAGPAPDPATHSIWALHSCPGCEAYACVTVEARWNEPDEKGKPQAKRNTLVEHALVNPAALGGLRSRLASS